MPIKLHHSIAVHPGIWLSTELVEPHGLSVAEAAFKLRVTPDAMRDLLEGRSPLSPEMAVRFEKAFGLCADTMMRMQARFDLTQVQGRVGDIAVERAAAQNR